jgi:hypothetical protein
MGILTWPWWSGIVTHTPLTTIKDQGNSPEFKIICRKRDHSRVTACIAKIQSSGDTVINQSYLKIIAVWYINDH